MSEDYDLLKRVAKKAAEPFGDDNLNKTISEWRKEMAELMSEVIFYVAKHGE